MVLQGTHPAHALPGGVVIDRRLPARAVIDVLQYMEGNIRPSAREERKQYRRLC